MVSRFPQVIGKGIALIVHAYGSSLNDETFKEYLGQISAKALARLAQDSRSGSMGNVCTIGLIANPSTGRFDEIHC